MGGARPLGSGGPPTPPPGLGHACPATLSQPPSVPAPRRHPAQGDLRDLAFLERLFAETKFDSVIHFAARKYVNESVEDPLKYYDHNVVGTVNLAKAMRGAGVKRIVFSSSCTVYGNPQYVPIDEKHRLEAVSPYGRTKVINEEIFRDLAKSDPEWRIVLLRYFNPVGAHPSGACVWLFGRGRMQLFACAVCVGCCFGRGEGGYSLRGPLACRHRDRPTPSPPHNPRALVQVGLGRTR